MIAAKSPRYTPRMPSTADLQRLHELDADLGTAMGELVSGFKAAHEVLEMALEHFAEQPEAPAVEALMVTTEEASHSLERAWACAVWSLDGLDAGHDATAKRYATAFRVEVANARLGCPTLATTCILRAFAAAKKALLGYKRALRKAQLDDRLVYVNQVSVDVDVLVGHLRCRLPEELGKVIPFAVERAKRARKR